MSTKPIPIALLDFTTLPLRELASLLRAITRAEWNALFTGQPPHWEQTDLLHLARLLGRGSPGPSVDLKATTKHLVAGQTTTAAWRARVRDHLAHEFGGAPPDHIPDAFFIYTAEVAWMDLVFRSDIAAALLHHLCRCCIILPRETPAPVFATQTFWCLLALSCDSARPVARSETERTAITRLKKVAQEQASSPAWAGFWEQLVFGAARHRNSAWHSTFETLTPELCKGLLALPLVAGRGLASGRPPGPLTAPKWQAVQPGWYTARVDLGRGFKSGKPT